MLSFRPNTAIKKPAPARDRERIFTYPFLRETIPMMMLDTSIPRAQIVSAVPSVALSEKASTIGVNKVCRKPRKKVITEERRTSSRTPLRNCPPAGFQFPEESLFPILPDGSRSASCQKHAAHGKRGKNGQEKGADINNKEQTDIRQREKETGQDG